MVRSFEIKIPDNPFGGEAYDDITRFISYFYQVDLTKKLRCETILEIGIGNKTVSNYLKQQGLTVRTCDLYQYLMPDCAADVRALPFKGGCFDALLAFEILEHLPWNDVGAALGELARVTKRYVIVSVPYSSQSVELLILLPDFLRKIPLLWKIKFVDLFFRFRWLNKDIELVKHHYWEVGRKSYPVKRIRAELQKRFKMIEEVRPILGADFIFFVLEKSGEKLREAK